MHKHLTFADAKDGIYYISLRWQFHFLHPSDRRLVSLRVDMERTSFASFDAEFGIADSFGSWWFKANDYCIISIDTTEYYANLSDALARLTELFPLCASPSSQVEVSDVRRAISSLHNRRIEPTITYTWDLFNDAGAGG